MAIGSPECCLRGCRRYGAARRRKIEDGVSSTKARRRLIALKRAGHGIGTIQAVSNVPQGVLRKVLSGEADLVSRDHEALILHVTSAMCASVVSRPGSRGRSALAASELVDAEPIRTLLKDLAARRFGPKWVGRQLGYQGQVQINGLRYKRSVAEAVEALHRDLVGADPLAEK